MSCKFEVALAAVFFVAIGSVCSDSAIGQDSAESPAEASQDVTVTDYDTVSLNVQETDLAQVLQLLSIQGRRNIVPSPNVKGKVTANLYDVTFDEALEAILVQNGAGFRKKGNFIYVYTQDELRKIQQAERQVAYRVFRLNYITANDASTFVTPLLTSAGSIAISGQTAPGFQPTLSDGGANDSADVETMVVRDYPEVLDEVAKVIHQLDVRPRQVLVEATILKADVTENNAFGVDFSILSNIAVDAFTNPLNAVNDLIDGTVQPSDSVGGVTSSVGNVENGTAGLKVGVVTNNVAAFIRALDSITDTTIVANPKLLVLNRMKADVLVGEKIGYLSTTATATATTQTVEFLDTGTQLTVRPFVSDDGYIRIEIKPQISSARIRDVVPGTDTSAITIPDEITQELTTNVMVRDGQTIVLGGLFKEETTISRDQVPLLGDIPIAGEAFKGRGDTLSRSEVIFLITPHIVKDQALAAAADVAEDGVEQARIGAREGLLPWSRSKMTAAHLREALKALEDGDRDTALYEVDLALGLDPTQTEALRLKEKLTGQRAYWPDRSLLDEAVDVMVEKQTGRRPQRKLPVVPDPGPSKPDLDSIGDAAIAEPADDTQAQAPTGADQADQAQAVAPEVSDEPVTVELPESDAADPSAGDPTDTSTESTASSGADAETDAAEASQAEPGDGAEAKASASADVTDQPGVADLGEEPAASDDPLTRADVKDLYEQTFSQDPLVEALRTYGEQIDDAEAGDVDAEAVPMEATTGVEVELD